MITISTGLRLGLLMLALTQKVQAEYIKIIVESEAFINKKDGQYTYGNESFLTPMMITVPTQKGTKTITSTFNKSSCRRQSLLECPNDVVSAIKEFYSLETNEAPSSQTIRKGNATLQEFCTDKAGFLSTKKEGRKENRLDNVLSKLETIEAFKDVKKKLLNVHKRNMHPHIEVCFLPNVLKQQGKALIQDMFPEIQNVASIKTQDIKSIRLRREEGPSGYRVMMETKISKNSYTKDISNILTNIKNQEVRETARNFQKIDETFFKYALDSLCQAVLSEKEVKKGYDFLENHGFKWSMERTDEAPLSY